MSLVEKCAIQEVIAQYSYTWDAKDVEGFANLFVEEAVWEAFRTGETLPHVHLESRTAIREWAAQRHQGPLAGIRTCHHQSGVLFEVLTADRARTRTMLLLTHQEATDAVPRLILSGVYQDEWRKMPEGWRFVHRTLRG